MEAGGATDELLDELNQGGHAVVADHWALEVGSTLLTAERRKRTTVAESSQFLALARAHGLTLFDGSYLELAMRMSLPKDR